MTNNINRKVMDKNLTLTIDSDWLHYLKDEFDKPYFKDLQQFLNEQLKQGTTILPEQHLWFNALNTTPLDRVKVVILGQDPYPTAGHAHGLSFSVLPEVSPLPKSLLNINKELLSDLQIDNSYTGNLHAWAQQGVLLLNSVLTVESGKANSHQGKGWEQFTDSIIETINEHTDNTVFILWGAYAQKKGQLINLDKHHIIKSAHPSPLAAYRGFWNSKPFSKTNSLLENSGKKAINWSLLP